jgi:hypothetical protein
MKVNEKAHGQIGMEEEAIGQLNAELMDLDQCILDYERDRCERHTRSASMSNAKKILAEVLVGEDPFEEEASERYIYRWPPVRYKRDI